MLFHQTIFVVVAKFWRRAPGSSDSTFIWEGKNKPQWGWCSYLLPRGGNSQHQLSFLSHLVQEQSLMHSALEMVSKFGTWAPENRWEYLSLGRKASNPTVGGADDVLPGGGKGQQGLSWHLFCGKNPQTYSNLEVVSKFLKWAPENNGSAFITLNSDQIVATGTPAPVVTCHTWPHWMSSLRSRRPCLRMAHISSTAWTSSQCLFKLHLRDKKTLWHVLLWLVCLIPGPGSCPQYTPGLLTAGCAIMGCRWAFLWSPKRNGFISKNLNILLDKIFLLLASPSELSS